MMKTPLAIVVLYCCVVAYGLSTTIYQHVPGKRGAEWGQAHYALPNPTKEARISLPLVALVVVTS